MRFTSFLVAGSLAIVAYAEKTNAEDPTGTSNMDAVQSSIEACIKTCDPKDIGCLARCNPVPNPDRQQIADTNACVAKCDQGDGSKEETEKYGNCINACIKEHYYDATQGTPKPTGSVVSGGSEDDGDKDDGDKDDGKDDDDANTTVLPTATSTGSKPKTSDSDSDDSWSTSGSSAAPTSDAPTKSLQEDKADNTKSGDGKATETGDGEDAATGLIASSSALFAAIVAILAL